MKTFFYFLAITILVCGCNKPPSAPVVQKWEYKVIEVENFEHSMKEQAEAESSTNIDQAIKDENYANADAGDFNLNIVGAESLGWKEKYAADLDKLGKDGWELVAAIPQTETLKAEDFSNTRTGKIILIFKRSAQ
jgi:hypothetical protein